MNEQFARMLEELRRRVSDLERLESAGTVPANPSAAPVGATYVTMSANATLTAERVLTEGAGLDQVDAGANSTVTIGLGGDTILLYKANGDPVVEFAFTSAGLTAALAAAADYNTIQLPSGILALGGGSFTIPAHVTVKGMGPETIIQNATVTVYGQFQNFYKQSNLTITLAGSGDSLSVGTADYWYDNGLSLIRAFVANGDNLSKVDIIAPSQTAGLAYLELTGYDSSGYGAFIALRHRIQPAPYKVYGLSNDSVNSEPGLKFKYTDVNEVNWSDIMVLRDDYVKIIPPIYLTGGFTGQIPDVITTITGTTTLGASHGAVWCNSASAFTVTLPAAASSTNYRYDITNIGAGVVTVDANGAELISGQTTQTLNQWDTLVIRCNGSIWAIG